MSALQVTFFPKKLNIIGVYILKVKNIESQLTIYMNAQETFCRTEERAHIFPEDLYEYLGIMRHAVVMNYQ